MTRLYNKILSTSIINQETFFFSNKSWRKRKKSCLKKLFSYAQQRVCVGKVEKSTLNIFILRKKKVQQYRFAVWQNSSADKKQPLSSTFVTRKGKVNNKIKFQFFRYITKFTYRRTITSYFRTVTSLF